MNFKLIILLCLGVWIGLLIGLSFLEAPLKFTAEGITLELGLAIGRIMFTALNKLEIGLSVIIALLIGFSNFRSYEWVLLALLFGLFAIVMLQSVWLLPSLDFRAAQIISGIKVQASFHHIIYVGFEVIKLIILPVSFYKIFKL